MARYARLAALLAGFALAVLPLSAAADQTPAAGTTQHETQSAAVEHAATPAAEHGAEAHGAVAHGEGGHGGEHGASNRVDAIHHVVDSEYIEVPWPNAHLTKKFHLPSLGTYQVGGVTFNMQITKHVVFMWIVATLLLVFVGGVAARKARPDRVPTGFLNFVEVFVVFIRDEIAIPAMGPRYGRTLLPYMLSVFFFILTCNLIGLVPYSATATGNISVTAGLAILSFIMIQAVAIKEAGILGWLKHLTGGVHPIMWPIMIPVEILGLFTKPFALCVRLFANMTAGHIVILSLLGLIFIFGNVGVAAISVPFSLFIFLLELLVALLQAYVFTMLTATFIGLGVHSDHGEEGHAEEAHA